MLYFLYFFSRQPGGRKWWWWWWWLVVVLGRFGKQVSCIIKWSKAYLMGKPSFIGQLWSNITTTFRKQPYLIEHWYEWVKERANKWINQVASLVFKWLQKCQIAVQSYIKSGGRENKVKNVGCCYAARFSKLFKCALSGYFRSKCTIFHTFPSTFVGNYYRLLIRCCGLEHYGSNIFVLQNL